MMTIARVFQFLPVAALAVGLVGCDKPKETTTAPSASATAATPSATASAATPSPEAKKPSHPCPEGSTGDGTRNAPCEAAGATRIMDATWTGKTDDKGPKFKLKSKSKLEILYGEIVFYFYDKSGKQLEVAAGDTAGPKLSCTGNIFGGAVKAEEKVFMYFSCLKQKSVPEGTVAIEGEVKVAGFTDASGKKSDTFWRNKDLAPDKRPKGGVN